MTSRTQNNRPVRTAVVGVGALGRHHARLYAESPEAELVGVFDVDPDQAARISEQHACHVFDSLDAVAAAAEAVSVAVPTNLHATVVSQLLESDLHVLVEKPLAASGAEGEKLVRQANARGLVLGVGHVERYNPVLACISDTPGAPRFISAERLAFYPPERSGLHRRGTEVSVVHDLMIHDLDVVLSLVDGAVDRLDAVGVAILSDSEDIANARLHFENGCVANLNVSRVSREPLRKIRLFKNRAYLSLDYQAQAGVMAQVTDGAVKHRPVPIREGNALLYEIEDFCRCVRVTRGTDTVAQPRVSGEAGLAALVLADRITQQCRE